MPRADELRAIEAPQEERVTPLELFFDLVFVLSFTQVTATMAHDPTWAGLGEGMLILAAVWWAWAAYGWLTNAIDPDENLNRLAMFSAMAAMLIVSLSIPAGVRRPGAAVRLRLLLRPRDAAGALRAQHQAATRTRTTSRRS